MTPRTRVVLLGASNLTRAVSTVTSWLAARLPPFDLYLAYGFGRSYGVKSHVFGRDLPGIVPSGLWRALDEADARDAAVGSSGQKYALLTDVGNDLFYEQSVETITAWLRSCLDRLARDAERIILVQLPIENIDRVTRAQFWFLTQALFPGRDLSFDRLKADAHRLARVMEDLAREYGCHLAHQPASWYGFDPIHYKFLLWPRVWDQVLAPFAPAAAGAAALAPLPRPNFSQWVRFRRAAAEQRWVLGRERRSVQPSGILPGGTRIFSY